MEAGGRGEEAVAVVGGGGRREGGVQRALFALAIIREKYSDIIQSNTNVLIFFLRIYSDMFRRLEAIFRLNIKDIAMT